MANNQYVNQVAVNGTTIIDLTADTVTPSTLLQGYTAHDASGAAIVGTATGGGSGAVTQDENGYIVLDDEGGSSVTVEALSVTQNGTYTAPTGKAYSPVTVTVSGGGGGGWVRPSDWPDLSQMDVSGGDILYMTSYADMARGFCRFACTCTGSYTVEVGSISGSIFTADSTQSYASNSYCELFYGTSAGGYKVLRVTGTSITKLTFAYNNAVVIDGHTCYAANQGIIDVVGKLPHGTVLSCRDQHNLVNMEISGLVLNGSIANMFYNCTSLTALDVSGFDTSSVTNMSGMFSNCYSLTSIDVSEFDTSSVESMSSMFFNCTSLTSIDVSEFDTSSVTNMSTMFGGCYSLTSIDVSGFDTSRVESMSSMFYNCASLRDLDVSGFDTSSVTSMSSMFYGCYSLTSIDVSEFDTSSVTNMSSMFYYCHSLSDLDVSGFDFTKVTTNSAIQNMFSTCYALRGPLTLPATVTMVGSNMFASCRSLTEWHFLSTTPPTLNATNAFGSMTDYGGKVIYVPSESLSDYQSAANWSTYASYMVGE